MNLIFSMILFLLTGTAEGISCYQGTRTTITGSEKDTVVTKECALSATTPMQCYSYVTFGSEAYGCVASESQTCSMFTCCYKENCNDPDLVGSQNNMQECIDAFTNKISICPNIMAPPSGNDISAGLDDFCQSDCFGHIKMSTTEFIACIGHSSSGMDYGKLIDAQCTKNDVTGEYCLVHQTRMAEIAISVTTTTDTSDSYKLICDTYAEWGCCFTSLLSVYSTFTSTTMDSWLDLCQWSSMPRTCTAPGETTNLVDVKVNSNIKWDKWVLLTQEQKDVAKLAASKDLARKIGVTNEKVSPAQVSQGQNGTDLEFTLLADDIPTGMNQTQLQESLDNNPGGWTELETVLPVDSYDGSVQVTGTVVQEMQVVNNANVNGRNSYHKVTPSSFAWFCSALLTMSFIWTSM